jgi:hypothetical protein
MTLTKGTTVACESSDAFSEAARCSVKLARLLLVCLLGYIPVFASPRVDLNSQWYFRVDPSKVGEQQRWSEQLPPDVEQVNVPHTWNMGKLEDFIGTAWYFKSFQNNPAWKGQHVEIHFGATFYKSRVWFNGKLIGEHEGGFSDYHFDLTGALQDNNFLAVELNNEAKLDSIPGIPVKNGPESMLPDWWPYGGIIRDVWLTTNDVALIRRQQIRSKPSADSAEVSDEILVENLTPTEQTLKLTMAIVREDNNASISTIEKEVKVHAGVQRLTISTQFSGIHLWQIDNPFLYRSEVTLKSNSGRLLDSQSDNFGIRTVEIRSRHLYLNGERVRLTGLARHEDSPWEGMAETRGTIWHDFDDLKDLYTTLTRPVHYPQNPIVYDYADHHGMLLIPEIPMWQFDEGQMTNPKVLALARQMFTELIEQNYNHPSIFAWSTDNESATDTPGGIAYFKNLSALAKQLDPDRYVTLADDRIAFVKDPATDASSLADFIMWNEYFGSWDGPESLLPAAFMQIERGYPDKMVIVSEFGFAGLFATDPRTADKKRVEIIQNRLAEYARHDWIGGAILWSYQDYHSTHNLRPGQADSYVDHGVVDKNRQRKPSYFAWQKDNTPAHLHIEWDYDSKGIPTGFHATISRRSEQEIPSYPLINYTAEWKLLDQDHKKIVAGRQALSVIGSPENVDSKWPGKTAPALYLEIVLRRTDGSVAQSKVLSWRDLEKGKLTEGEVDNESENILYP